MRELSLNEVEQVSGGWNFDLYAVDMGMAMGFLTLGLTVTAPVWGTAALLGGSIFASGVGIYNAWN